MEKLDKILADHVANGEETKGKVFGAAFVVVDKDGIRYQGAAGRTAQATDAPKFATNSFTWVASMTKIVTSTCLMQLVERGQINLDDDVRPLVPELARMQILDGFNPNGEPILLDNTTPITLRHLLTHTVGLGYDIVDPDLVRWSEAVGRTTTNLTWTLEGWNTPLKFPPGEGWKYGSAMDWAGQVLEKITGVALSQYTAEHIFKPLGMEDTTFHPNTLTERTKDRRIPCAFRDSETGSLTNGPLPVPLEPPIESGGAGLWTTALDHAKVLQALLRDSLGYTPGQVLRKGTVDEMLRTQLNGVQRRMLKTTIDEFREGMASEFPPDTPLDHGISGIINTKDVPGKRKKGSMTWLGMANGHWWIDRESGIAASLVVNVLPLPDLVVNKLYDELELAVYADLLTNR